VLSFGGFSVWTEARSHPVGAIDLRPQLGTIISSHRMKLKARPRCRDQEFDWGAAAAESRFTTISRAAVLGRLLDSFCLYASALDAWEPRSIPASGRNHSSPRKGGNGNAELGMRPAKIRCGRICPISTMAGGSRCVR